MGNVFFGKGTIVNVNVNAIKRDQGTRINFGFVPDGMDGGYIPMSTTMKFVEDMEGKEVTGIYAHLGFNAVERDGKTVTYTNIYADAIPFPTNGVFDNVKVTLLDLQVQKNSKGEDYVLAVVEHGHGEDAVQEWRVRDQALADALFDAKGKEIVLTGLMGSFGFEGQDVRIPSPTITSFHYANANDRPQKAKASGSSGSRSSGGSYQRRSYGSK